MTDGRCLAGRQMGLNNDHLFSLLLCISLNNLMVLHRATCPSALEPEVDKLSREHNISCEDLKSLLRHYEEARMAGIPDRTRQSPLGHPRCLLLVGTVVSTIGFGVSAPSTITGKVLLVFYGLLGCSASILFFNLFLERVITFLSFLILWWHRRKAQHSTLEGRRNENDSNEERKPSVYQVTLVLFVAVLVIACGAASVYSAMEGWTYLESLYFCFVAFSTVGFGDFVSGQREHHEDTHAYKIANCLLMLLGVCCTYSLFSAISVIIKQGLTWMLKTLSWMYSSMKQYRLQIRPLPGSVFGNECVNAMCFVHQSLRGQMKLSFILLKPVLVQGVHL
uniref:Si:ch211-261a10.5 n=1 Tax=Sphaeramia orbicularis TaxID=375764 RepID=A0A673B358_9TELE